MPTSVSILIPTYNNGKFLLECIGSILRQNYHDYEIVIVDDYSTDETKDIVNGLMVVCCKRLKYYKNKNTKGLVGALNYGISKCKGEFIVRMDADDIMLGDRIQQQVSFLQENPAYAAVGSGMQIINRDGCYVRNMSVNTDGETCRLMLMFCNTFAHPTMTIRTDILKKERYKKSFLYCEDYELWTRISARYPMKNLPFIHNGYRIHGDNISTNKEKIRLQRVNILKLHARLLADLGIDYTEKDLLLHFSLFNYTTKVGTSQEIKCWLEKVFSTKALADQFDKTFLDITKKKLLTRFVLDIK